MAKQLVSKKENTSNIVCDIPKSVVDQVVTKERNETKLTTDHQMTRLSNFEIKMLKSLYHELK